MKKKVVKKILKSENNYFKYVAMLLLVIFAAVGVTKILGLEINKNTLVCEDKKGNLFVPRDKDGNIDECKKHDEAVTFNFEGENSDTQTPFEGDVLFVDYMSDSMGEMVLYVLLKNGFVYRQDKNTTGLVRESSMDVPPELMNKRLVSWSIGYLQTSEGKVYFQASWGSGDGTIGNWNLLKNIPTVASTQ